jgi:choline dehydrogenase
MLYRSLDQQGQGLLVDVYNGTKKDLFKCVNSIYKVVRSTSARYLEGKRNVTLSSTLTRNIIIDGGKAVGVTVIGPNGNGSGFRAKYEVVISQGVYRSPS